MIPKDPWDAYDYLLEQWRRLGKPEGLEPLRPIQRGTHIDSLPVENNSRGRSGVLIPTIVPDEPQ